ncbi:Tat pathway signal protein [Phocaeicola abscessus]|uniref:Tat pathway signal protein n=1 Tax=Phocaeicola abscessus TaxID=555313 RepID=UPI0004B77B18|nr:Tat pathway signal protein [Phocaeicola abscessus]
MERRTFIKQMAMAGVMAGLPGGIAARPFVQKVTANKREEMIWANLIHLSFNMWLDNSHTIFPGITPDVCKQDFQPKNYLEQNTWALEYHPFLTFDEAIWNKLLLQMKEEGFNTVIIDLGDAIRYESHPEIAVKNAWSTEKLRTELAKIRNLGLEPVPKLNFATAHDAWLGEYARMVSTRKYYDVCADLLSEVVELFDTPRLFHIGMDEEDVFNQRNLDYLVIRQKDLWWEDLYFYVKQLEKKNVRAWVWSDYAWANPEMFYKKMPTSVLQSNWYYDAEFDPEKIEESRKVMLETYYTLEKHGYDQVPTGSNWTVDTNMEDTVGYCKNIIDPSRLKGFMMASWRVTLDRCLDKHRDAIEQLGRAKKDFYKEI